MYLHFRRAVQLLALLAFVSFLVVPALYSIGEIFFQVSAVSIGTAYLAMKTTAMVLLVALAFLLVAALFGRVFCGWVCPLGTIGDAMDYVMRQPPRSFGHRRLKYALLMILIVIGAAGVTAAWYLDPINWAARIGGLLASARVEVGLSVFLLVLLLFVQYSYGRRGFCRNLCPLGAMLGIAAGSSPFRLEIDKEKCIECGTCVKNCRTGAFLNSPNEHMSHECIFCMECQANCPTGAIDYNYVRPKAHHEIKWMRRAFLATVAGSTVLALSRKSIAAPEDRRIRPPGTGNDFEHKCTRCGTCIRVCPNNALRADWHGSGDRFMLPYLDGRQGGCDYDCTLCLDHCPTGAIRKLPLAEKRELKIGFADINREACYAYRGSHPCVICYSACTIRAITLKPVDSDAKAVPVIGDTCTGCAQCEAACPVPGAGAIRTVSPVVRKQRK